MSSRFRLAAYVILITLFAGVVVSMLTRLAMEVDTARVDAERAERIAAANEDVAEQNTAAVEKLARQVRGLGGKPVVEPSEVPEPVPPSADPPTVVLPTAAQVAAAVLDYCSSGRCRGADGASASSAQVSAAVSRYCAGGRCRGVPGESGDDGQDGQDGADGVDGSPGADGPGPTDAQVAQAVADYCSDGRCRGADGEDGEDGEDGSVTPGTYACPDGSFVRAIVVASDGSMTLECGSGLPPLPNQ